MIYLYGSNLLWGKSFSCSTVKSPFIIVHFKTKPRHRTSKPGFYVAQCLNYNSRSTLWSSFQGRPCLLSSAINGSGSNSSTLNTPGFFQSPFKYIIAPIIQGTPVVQLTASAPVYC